jgi:sulfate adenylyltransferase
MVNTPYGGRLVNRILSEEEKQRVFSENLPRVKINNTSVTEVKNICNGIYSPLEGFMNQKQFSNILLFVF